MAWCAGAAHPKEQRENFTTESEMDFSTRQGSVAAVGRWYRWKTRIKNWLPVFAWAGLIFYFSTDQFSSLNTGEIFGFLLSWLFPDMPSEEIEPVHGIMRKLGHWGEYFVLSVLFLWALENETGRRWKVRHAIYTLIFVLLYAIGDEFHQSLVPSRTASFGDVTIDLLGGICGVGWTYWYGRGILAR
jgi:VanZ family protein